MPRNVRNFWLTIDVDGKQTPVACGPRAKDGGFSIRVQIRDAGTVREAGYLWGHVAKDGSLVLQWDGGESCPDSCKFLELARTSR